ncbi:MAG: hypothetical protein WD024_04765 [Bacillota bacterium]
MTARNGDSVESRNSVRASAEYVSRRPEFVEMAKHLPDLIVAYREVAASQVPCGTKKNQK